MADDFFGFDTTFPRSNVLRHRGLEGELLTEVEEEFDALNDETFGKAENDDWEEAHEKLSDLIKKNNLSGGSFFNDSLLDNDASQEEIVSKSISQLGLEDDLDDPAIMTISHASTNSSHKSLRSSFNASPPPPAILETEICGSPKTHSIWSTTPKDSGISSFLHVINRGSGSQSYPDSSTPLKMGRDNVFVTPAKAWRAEELEQDLLSTPSRESPHHSPSWPRPPSPQHVPSNISADRMLTHEEVEKCMMFEQRHPFSAPGPNHLYPIMQQPNLMGQLMGSKGNIPNGSIHTPPVMPLRPLGNPDPLFIARMNNMMQNRMPIRGPVPNLPPGFNPPNMNLNHVKPMVLPPRTIAHPLMYKQFQFPMYVLNKQYENEYFEQNGQVYDDEYAGLMTQKEREWLIRIQLLQLKSDNPYIEDYYYTTQVARRCQKKFSENSSKSSAEAPELILPETTRHESKAFVPLQFEGSLGKLQAVSVNFPRKVLDITVTRASEEEEGKTEDQSRVKYRQLLLDIEKLYRYLLDIEDEERRILAKPDSDSGPHRDNIAKLKNNIFSGLFPETSADENFQNIMTIRKGRNLVMRVFKIFNTEQQLHCLLFLFRCIVLILKKDQNDHILLQNINGILTPILKYSLNELVLLTEAMDNGISSEFVTPKEKDRNSFATLLKNKFGSSVICALITRAENIFKTSDSIETDIKHRWTKLVVRLTDSICMLPESSICQPLSPVSSLLSHFNRFAIQKEKLVLIKERIVMELGSQN